MRNRKLQSAAVPGIRLAGQNAAGTVAVSRLLRSREGRNRDPVPEQRRATTSRRACWQACPAIFVKYGAPAAGLAIPAFSQHRHIGGFSAAELRNEMMQPARSKIFADFTRSSRSRRAPSRRRTAAERSSAAQETILPQYRHDALFQRIRFYQPGWFQSSAGLATAL